MEDLQVENFSPPIMEILKLIQFDSPWMFKHAEPRYHISAEGGNDWSFAETIIAEKSSFPLNIIQIIILH